MFAKDAKPVIDWTTIILMTIFHVLAAYALTMFTMSALISFLVMYAVSVLGITMGFHRLHCHRSFKAPVWLGRILAFMGTLALQGSIKEWVALHRMHHIGSDTPDDPHDASRGFMHSHLYWMFVKDTKFDDLKLQNRFSRDIISDPFLRFISEPIVMIGLQVVLGLLLWTLFGVEAMMWGIWLRLVAVYHVTWLVNSASHMFGYRNFILKDDRATNCWWVGLLAFGEGWHNNHHAVADSARHGLKWWEFDITWQFIKIFRVLGVVTDVKVAQLPKPDITSEPEVPDRQVIRSASMRA